MWKSGLKWMFLIIGTMVGAGYASGRELWQFFGQESGLAIVLFTVLFIISVGITMKVSYQHQTSNYYVLLEIILGKHIARFYDILIFFYLMSTTVIMIAGSGATFEAFQLSKWLGILSIVVFIIMIFMKGIKGVVTFNVIILPLLMIGLLSILMIYSIDEQLTFIISLENQANWTAAFTFTALNILSILAVLGAVGDKIKSNGEIIIASVGSGLILGITSLLYNNSLIQISEIIILYEIPLFAILKNYPSYTYIIMSILLWCAIFTTAISSVLGLVSRIARFLKYHMWQIAMILLILLIPLTNIGFSTLIAFLYPIYGIVNLYLLCAILLFPFYKRI
ncbi:YkvI family membrane protein [Gracilibacillus sp. HCP3S3_G5_1]|uniref:YkvI family membrane protein n=1 Tax=unclassified Gracilibacillus TaxID=2625209 RepID=UPI003F8C6CE7